MAEVDSNANTRPGSFPTLRSARTGAGQAGEAQPITVTYAITNVQLNQPPEGVVFSFSTFTLTYNKILVQPDNKSYMVINSTFNSKIF